ncbi:MAG: hypothetical protein A2583_13270 [Bdellovibrionales bacterium RIFOXYD1_FULL_53_11]|nr:MAG: hypothetical protein A2583_13270 [Bdellovibrionales bacterium RIFOXYD1_FULL_53_11]
MLAAGVALAMAMVTPVFTFSPVSSHAETENYSGVRVVQEGGFIDIPYGSIVQGSIEHSGIQPNYVINPPSDAELEKFLERARKLNKQKIPLWEKVEKVLGIVRRAMPRKDYKDPRYLALLEKYRRTNRPVPLGEYLKIRAGVCREYALLTHLALKEAGIDNKFVYAFVERPLITRAEYGLTALTREDHAFTVIKDNKQLWIVDSYSPYFNRQSYTGLRNGISIYNKHAPAQDALPGFRKIIKVRKFPVVRLLDADCRETISNILKPPRVKILPDQSPVL